LGKPFAEKATHDRVERKRHEGKSEAHAKENPKKKSTKMTCHMTTIGESVQYIAIRRKKSSRRPKVTNPRFVMGKSVGRRGRVFWGTNHESPDHKNLMNSRKRLPH